MVENFEGLWGEQERCGGREGVRERLAREERFFGESLNGKKIG